MSCQWRCASGSADSWLVCGGNGEWWARTVGAVTKCSSQANPDGSVYSPRLTRHAKEILCHRRAWRAYAYHRRDEALTDKCLKSLVRPQMSAMERKQYECETRPGRRFETNMSDISTDKSQLEGVPRKTRMLPQHSFFLNYLQFTEGDDGLV